MTNGILESSGCAPICTRRTDIDKACRHDAGAALAAVIFYLRRVESTGERSERGKGARTVVRKRGPNLTAERTSIGIEEAVLCVDLDASRGARRLLRCGLDGRRFNASVNRVLHDFLPRRPGNRAVPGRQVEIEGVFAGRRAEERRVGKERG